jgi:hypothetical protein
LETKQHQILKDKALDQHLLEEGYVIIPFLNETEIQEFKQFYEEQGIAKPKGLYATAHVDDAVFRGRINEYIKEKNVRAMNEYFDNCTPLGGTFIVKGPGEEGELMPHQDWNIVDEDQGHRSFNIWTTLVDTNEDNGAILILEKSHNKLRTIRGSNIPCAFHQVYDQVWPKMKMLPMKAGEALVYDHRLLHASHHNKTDELRLATVYGIISKSAQMKYYYKNNEQIEEYDCVPEFYINENPFKGPNGLEKTRNVPYDFPLLNEDTFCDTFGYEKPIKEEEVVIETIAKKKGFLNSIISLFGRN